jgi:protein-tyrosine phosphatase
MTEKDLKYIDFHSHILPKVDDGSCSVDESLKMLTISEEYGVKRIVATPHFYPTRERPETFLQRRDEALAVLSDAIKNSDKSFPKIYLGAEVAFFDGISNCRFLEELCIVGTKTILVEMPADRWSQSVCDGFMRIRDAGFVPVIAHAERCLPMQDSDVKRMLLDEKIILQINGEAFLKLGTRRFAVSLARKGHPLVIGSDCHNLTSRAPNLDKAVDIIVKKLGEGAIWDMMDTANDLVGDNA